MKEIFEINQTTLIALVLKYFIDTKEISENTKEKILAGEIDHRLNIQADGELGTITLVLEDIK